jgi:hypothetical protein
MAMALFKGFNQIDLLKEEPRVLIAVLAEQLAITNKALEAGNEEIKQLRNKVDHISNQQMADTM